MAEGSHLYQKGGPKPPGSGRKRGGRNKKTEVYDQLRKLKVEPVVGAIEMINRARELDDYQTALNGYMRLLEYTHHKKRAIDIDINMQGEVHHEIMVVDTGCPVVGRTEDAIEHRPAESLPEPEISEAEILAMVGDERRRP